MVLTFFNSIAFLISWPIYLGGLCHSVSSIMVSQASEKRWIPECMSAMVSLIHNKKEATQEDALLFTIQNRCPEGFRAFDICPLSHRAKNNFQISSQVQYKCLPARDFSPVIRYSYQTELSFTILSLSLFVFLNECFLSNKRVSSTR